MKPSRCEIELFKKNLIGLLDVMDETESEEHNENDLNAKAFHELIRYYLRERITNHNLEIKHLVATNIYEWCVFDAVLFEKTFADNKKLVQQFTDFKEERLAGKNTDFFYKEIAEPFVAGLDSAHCFLMYFYEIKEM